MASPTRSEIERRALALFERLVDQMGHTRLRERLLRNEPPEVLARLAALERAATDARAIPTLIPGSGDCEDAALPPARVGAFRLVERLGRGGMGDVWLGERDDGLYEQKVAVKLIQRHALARAAAAFDDERRFLARLEHPNIARLIDGGVTEDGLPWLVTEYVEGRPIHEAAAGLPLAERVRLFVKAADAVQFAHGRMIAHADLKPGNILVTEDGRVKLLDFGISALIGGDARTPVGSGPLTRAFASPERIAGEPPSVADDVYALGKTLALILSPSPAGRERGPDRELRAIADKASAPLAADRYTGAAALIADLDRWRDGLPVSALPPAWSYRARKFVERHRAGVAATTAALVLLTGTSLVATANYVRAESTRARAEQRFGEVRHLSRFMLFDLYDDLSRRPGTVAGRAEIARTSADYLERLRVAADAPADLRLDTARSYRRLAAIQGLPGVSNLGMPEAAAASLDKAEALLRALVKAAPRDAEALAELGWVHADRWTLLGEGERSARENEAAAKAFHAALAADPRNASAALGRLVTDKSRAFELIWTADRPQEALALAWHTLARLRATPWPEPLRPAALQLEINLLNRIGDATYYAGDEPGSLAPYEEADALVDRAVAREGEAPHWLILKGENAFNISGTLQELPGRRADALRVAREGQASLKRVLAAGPDAAAEKKLLVLYGQEAALLGDAGRALDALTPSAASIALRRARLARSPADPRRMRDLAIGLAPHAELLARAGRAPEACRAAAEAARSWAAIRSAGQLGALDARKNLPQSETLRKKLCAG
jgi:serine/threonine-protein kinase